jgi:hypothetical protein
MAGLIVVVAGADGARANPGTNAWSTYLRSGPSGAAPVIDELEHDTSLDIKSCAHRWCLVQDGQIEGYIDQDALTLPRPAPPPGAASGPCFVADQDGYKKPTPTRFCQAKPQTR